MAKILILANNDLGLYKFRKELLEELVNNNYEVFTSLPYGELIPNIEQIGCKFIETNIDRRGTNPIKDIKLFFAYLRIINKVKPDIILTYTIKPNVYGGLAARLSRRPYIANITGLGSATEHEGILQNITLFLYKIGLKNADCVFFQNKENQKLFENHKITLGKHQLIPGSGVNLDHFSLLEYPDDNTVEFVFISRIMKEKGIDQFLKAAKYIRKKYPFTRFHILGFCEEDYEKKLQKYQENDIIEYHGMQKDIRKFLKKTHCTIHPTYYPEGMSNVLLESAASGRPIITTNRSGCREIVDDGVNGYIVEQQNTKDLINKIEKFLALNYEEKKQMGLAGRKKVETTFDRQIVVNAYIKQIKSGIG